MRNSGPTYKYAFRILVYHSITVNRILEKLERQLERRQFLFVCLFLFLYFVANLTAAFIETGILWPQNFRHWLQRKLSLSWMWRKLRQNMTFLFQYMTNTICYNFPGSACDVTTLSNVHDFGSSPRDESRSQSPHSWESLPPERNTEDYSNGVTQPGSSGGCKNQAYIVNELDGNANNSNKQGEIGHSTTSSDNRDVGYDQPHFSDVSERSSQTLSERNESSPTASGHAVDFSNDFVHTENSISCV